MIKTKHKNPSQQISDLQLKIDTAIKKNKNLETISTILKNYKQKGVEQSKVKDLLESMRVNSSEKYEDKILEILDIVSGFCDSKYRVW